MGCGCRGRELASALVADGHAVRGTTRRHEAIASIEAAGAEGVVGDPDRLGTLLPALEGIAVLCWLMASAAGTAEQVAALHGPRLSSLLDTLVDTPVRGLVYEAAGSADPKLLSQGVALARSAGRTHRMPVEIVEVAPDRRAEWTAAMRAAVGAVLSA